VNKQTCRLCGIRTRNMDEHNREWCCGYRDGDAVYAFYLLHKHAGKMSAALRETIRRSNTNA